MSDHQARQGSHLLLGLGLGALAMYFADPQNGRRRRALVANRYTHLTTRLRDGAQVARRDVSHRASGLAAQVRRFFNGGASADDVVLVERVRSALGRVTSHPGAIEVDAMEGRVELRGVALSHEAEGIVARVRRVPGVRSVDSDLVLHDEPGSIPSLQGVARRNGGPRSELMQENWSPAGRVAASAAGTALLVNACARGGVASAFAGLLGAGLIARAAANRSIGHVVGIGGPTQGVVVRKSIHVDATPAEAYRHWDIERFPQWMSHVREVRHIGGNYFHWVVDGPARVPVEWDAEITGAVENVYMSWRSVEGSIVDNAGSVRFRPEGDGTRVEITFCYMPPGGVLGHGIARVLGADPAGRLDDDLMRFKSSLETGRSPRDAAAHRGSNGGGALRH